jgi:hypothetical protein
MCTGEIKRLGEKCRAFGAYLRVLGCVFSLGTLVLVARRLRHKKEYKPYQPSHVKLADAKPASLV